MNIFALEYGDHDPVNKIDWEKSAISLDDMRVVKMITETNQIISTVLNENDIPAPYKSFNPKHPSVIWAGESYSNLCNLVFYNFCLCEEYTKRFGKIHAGLDILKSLDNLVHYCFIPDFDPTPMRLAMPDEFRSSDPVDSYRRYYSTKPNIRYTRSKAPDWFIQLRGDLPYISYETH